MGTSVRGNEHNFDLAKQGNAVCVITSQEDWNRVSLTAF